MSSGADRFIVNVEVALVDGERFLLIVRGAEEAHAAGTLSLVGGKVDMVAHAADVLEQTARREVLEEIGLDIPGPLHYVYSSAFTTDSGEPVVNVVFVGRAPAATPRISDPGEVAAVRWLTAAAVANDPLAPAWTRESIARAEHLRREGL